MTVGWETDGEPEAQRVGVAVFEEAELRRETWSRISEGTCHLPTPFVPQNNRSGISSFKYT